MKIAALQARIARLARLVGGGHDGGMSSDDLAAVRDELVAARADADALKALSTPFLDWAGKAERLSFEVPTLPLFVHERLSTTAIVETLEGQAGRERRCRTDLFGESDLPIQDRLLKAYEHRDGWVNRLVLGDSPVVMSSLFHYEGLGGQVQTIYMDPPCAVQFGSNFQPFVRKRVVTHGADEDMVREPEMVQAYRDTWELGVYSCLTCLRDRLRLARELLHPSGSIFVQMSDTNLHHVREVMDEVFGPECFVSQISFQITSGFPTRPLATLGEFLLWYARDLERLKVRKLFEEQSVVLGEGNARWVLKRDGICRGVKLESIANQELAKEEVLIDRPEKDDAITRVSGPFCVEAIVPTPVDWEGDGEEDSGDPAADAYADHVECMIEVLRRSPILHLGGGQRVSLFRVRRPARTMSLSAEASIEGEGTQTAAIIFGPENDAVLETPVFEAAREAYAKGYARLYVIGFAIQSGAWSRIATGRSACPRPMSRPAWIW